jgi:hypothetical protein
MNDPQRIGNGVQGEAYIFEDLFAHVVHAAAVAPLRHGCVHKPHYIIQNGDLEMPMERTSQILMGISIAIILLLDREQEISKCSSSV